MQRMMNPSSLPRSPVLHSSLIISGEERKSQFFGGDMEGVGGVQDDGTSELLGFPFFGLKELEHPPQMHFPTTHLHPPPYFLPGSSNGAAPHGFVGDGNGVHVLDGVGYSVVGGMPLEEQKEYAQPEQEWNEGSSNPFAFHPGNSDHGRKKAQALSRSMRRSFLRDRHRRHRIAEGIRALQQLVPSSKWGGQASALDEINDYVQHLQLQLKDLSGGRLKGKAVCSDPLFIREGRGHHACGQNTHESPEEMMGKLMEEMPMLAKKLVESKGLFLLPTTLAEELGSIGTCSFK